MSPTPPKSERIDSLIPHVLKRVEERHRPLVTIQQGWAGWVGKRLAAHTRPVSLQRGRLVVYADRPGDNFALSYQRAQLLEQIQAATEARVEEIVIRPGDVTTKKTQSR